MTSDMNEIRSTLNDLIESCKDSEEGYRVAADRVKDAEIRALFINFSRQRAQLAAQLQAEAIGIGGDPETSGSTAGAIHRGWLGLKSAVTTDNDLAVLDEAESGEDAIVKNYHHALAKDLPKDIRTIVERQYRDIQETHNQVRSLRDGHWKMEVPMAGLR